MDRPTSLYELAEAQVKAERRADLARLCFALVIIGAVAFALGAAIHDRFAAVVAAVDEPEVGR